MDDKITNTIHWYGYGVDMHYGRERNILDLSKYTMLTIINEVIDKERERIDKLIDMQIESRGGNK